MKTSLAIEKAGTAAALAKILKISPGAVSQWDEDIPDKRVWQLRVLRPEWFITKPDSEALPNLTEAKVEG